uniref:Uncharacterized protein n=1 Tax=Arundo donax TaxID=35708 RepID=A0A0A9DXU8_ARUDO
MKNLIFPAPIVIMINLFAMTHLVSKLGLKHHLEKVLPLQVKQGICHLFHDHCAQLSVIEKKTLKA